MAVRIFCINKDNGNHDNPHEAISHYGWVNENVNPSTQGKDTRHTMVDFIKKGSRAYVKDQYGNIADCYVRTSSRGTEFLQTRADGTYTDNLLKLPECK